MPGLPPAGPTPDRPVASVSIHGLRLADLMRTLPPHVMTRKPVSVCLRVLLLTGILAFLSPFYALTQRSNAALYNCNGLHISEIRAPLQRPPLLVHDGVV